MENKQKCSINVGTSVAYSVDAVGALRWHCHYHYHHNNHHHIVLLITNLKQFEKELPEVSCRSLPRLALARRTIRTNLASHLISVVLDRQERHYKYKSAFSDP